MFSGLQVAEGGSVAADEETFEGFDSPAGDVQPIGAIIPAVEPSSAFSFLNSSPPSGDAPDFSSTGTDTSPATDSSVFSFLNSAGAAQLPPANDTPLGLPPSPTVTGGGIGSCSYAGLSIASSEPAMPVSAEASVMSCFAGMCIASTAAAAPDAGNSCCDGGGGCSFAGMSIAPSAPPSADAPDFSSTGTDICCFRGLEEARAAVGRVAAARAAVCPGPHRTAHALAYEPSMSAA